MRLHLPETVAGIISLLAATALPLALFCIGSSINTSAIAKHLKKMPLISISKLVVSPAIGFLLFNNILGLPRIDVAVGTLLLSMPPAVSTFLYVKQFGGNTELAASSISFNTIVSLATIPAILFLLGVS